MGCAPNWRKKVIKSLIWHLSDRKIGCVLQMIRAIAGKLYSKTPKVPSSMGNSKKALISKDKHCASLAGVIID